MKETVMTLRIRRANLADAEVVAMLGRITFSETFGHLFKQHAGDLRAYLDHTFGVTKIRSSLSDPDNRYWLGSLDGLPVSYAKLKYPSVTPPVDDPEPAQLQKIYVLRDFLGQGIGRPMLQAALDDAHARSIKRVWLDVLRQNERAINFYRREQFETIGEDRYTIGAQTFTFDLMMRTL